MPLPCEQAAKEKVPKIKAELARKLKAEGKSQKEIAKVLDVTEAAISQYLSGKRAKAKQLTDVRRVEEVCKICGVCQR